ncbi:MAG: ABC transporter substrate-binding protein [Burkholderiaceae bacterium]
MPVFSRRAALRAGAAVCTLPLLPAQAQDSAALTVAQIIDESPEQHDVSRDFAVGARAAWAAVNADGGVRGQRVQHLVLATQGRSAELRQAWQTALAQPGCVALSGCVGDGVAATVAALQAEAPTLAHVAPWLMRPWQDSHDGVFPIFAGYQAQIEHALRSLGQMGIRQAGVVFGSPALRQQWERSLAQAAQANGLQLHATQANQPPLMVLFAGATPELHGFIGQLRLPAGRQCYVVALADVNLQVLTQLGRLPRGVSVIATQPVPMVGSSLPVVRAYRAALARWYDEAPTPQGLAGFIAARHTAELLAGVPGPITRASMLAACRRRNASSLGGYAVRYQGRELVAGLVTQAMLTADGRIVG